MNIISPYLRYFPPSEEPLSADVYFISGGEYTYIFDVGNNEESLREIESVKGKRAVILSHFHPDHTGNINRFVPDIIYAGGYTCKKLQKGTAVREKLTIDDGVRLEITPCPSPHAKGCLILTINSEYTLLGDLFYTRSPENNGAAQNMLHYLCGVDTRYFVVSHEKENIIEKERLISVLSRYFSK